MSIKLKHTIILSQLALLSACPAQCEVQKRCKPQMPEEIICKVGGGTSNSPQSIEFDDLRFYDGKHRGLVDSTGREIIPPIFAEIQYCGNGVYMATDPYPGHHYHYGNRKRLFNRNGVEQSYKLPTETRLIQVLSLGEAADSDPTHDLDELPNDALLIYAEKSRLGLCDLQGNVVLPPKYARIVYCQPAQGFFSFVDPSTGRQISSCIDLKTKAITSIASIPASCKPRFVYQEEHQPSGLSNSKTVVFVPVGPDRLIKVISPRTELFDKEYWSERRTCPIAVLDMFSRFLRQYNLVGMKEEQVFDLLGWCPDIKPVGYTGEISSITYGFSGGGCEPVGFGVKLNLDGGQVSSWNLFNGKRESPRVTTNGPIETAQPILGGFKFPGVQYPMIPDNE